VLSPFDIRFFRELRTYVEDETGEFRERLSSCKSFEDVKYLMGYMAALDDVVKEGEEIERRLTSGKEQ